MPTTFFIGDELGTIKSISCSKAPGTAEYSVTSTTLLTGSTASKSNAVQLLAVGSRDGKKLLAASRADGSSLLSVVDDSQALEVVHHWTEPRLKPDSRFVGLAISDRGTYSCTSNGALRLTAHAESETTTSTTTSLPMRLYDWHLSSSGDTFAYGGDEVELSVWNSELAFVQTAVPAISQKRKRGSELLPGEVWRAKNVSNDSLNLRQPVHVTSLTYLNSSSASNHHLLAGTQLGHVRRYDTRVARRPVADWKDMSKVGGVKIVQKGATELDAFVTDQGCNLFAIDLRNGRVIYSYKGLAGAPVSLALAPPHFLASTSRDHFFRLHSTFPPPVQVGGQQEQKGEVLCSAYLKIGVNAIAWDQEEDSVNARGGSASQEQDVDEDEDVWETMQDVEDDDDDRDREGDRVRHKKTRA